MITIIDYGMGNVGSVFNMLRKLRAKVQISNDKNEIAKSDKLILWGGGLWPWLGPLLLELLHGRVFGFFWGYLVCIPRWLQ